MNSNREVAKLILGPGTTPAPDRSIGAFLIDAGKLTPEDAERTLRYSREKGIRFGDAAVTLKLVTAEDIQQALSRQFDYPYLVPGESDVSEEVIAAWAPFSQHVEALRALRSQLLLRWFTGEEGRKAITVVSPGRREGRSRLCANLAVVFSQMGERTLLIDSDMRNPHQHELFGLKNSAGLSTILSDRGGLEAVQRIPAFVDLSVLTGGPIPPNPVELLGRQLFAELLQEAHAQYDVVVVDAPSAALGSDSLLIAQRTVGVLMVARCNHTRVDACRSLADEVLAARATVVGSVLSEH